MRVGFAGTPEFAAVAFRALLDAGFRLPLVLTQPDRPRGRGLRHGPAPVKALAQARGVPTLQPASLKSEAERASLLAVPLDVLVVAAYGLILPPAVLSWPRHGALNLHASLLPRWRGAAPIQRALLAGDSETGVTIMQMDAGLDTGPIVEQAPVPIAPRDTAATLGAKLAQVASAAIVAALWRLERDGVLPSTPQPSEGACYAEKVDKAEATIDWDNSAERIDRQIRAFDPVPGAATTLAGTPVKVWGAQPVDGEAGLAAAGTVVAASRDLLVACGKGTLEIRELQPAGGRRMSAAAFLAGHPLSVGAHFGR